MELAQGISSLVLGLRRKVNIKVRQPLSKIMVPIHDSNFEEQIRMIESTILSEVNVKEIKYLKNSEDILFKRIKLNYKTLGPIYGKLMKPIFDASANLSQEEISTIQAKGGISLHIENQIINLGLDDIEIIIEDIPGLLVANEGRLTVALDITITDELRQEGIAREFINRIQNLRKDSGFEVTDKINIRIKMNSAIDMAVNNFSDYIRSQTLANSIELVAEIPAEKATEVALDDTLKTLIQIDKI